MIGSPIYRPTLQNAYDEDTSNPQITGALHISGSVEWDAFEYLDATTGGTDNIFIGDVQNTANTGSYNIHIGQTAGQDRTTGSNCISIGRNASGDSTTGNDVVSIGSYAGWKNRANNLIAIGTNAGAFNTTGANNLYIGYAAGKDGTTATNNVGIGTNALENITSGISNFALGLDTLSIGTTMSFNVAMGTQALENNTADGNVAIGHNALKANSTGANGVAIGRSALVVNTTGDFNFGLGSYSLFSNTTGARNLAIGYEALKSNVSGDGNICIGYQAGLNETGSDKFYLANSSTSTPLIYGEFNNEIIKINGQTQFAASTTSQASTKFYVGAGPTTPETGEFWFSENHLVFVPVADERIVTLGNGTTTSDSTVANTVTETEIANVAISADEFHVGQLIKFVATGFYSTANASDTFTVRVKLGGTTIATLVSDAQNVTDKILDIDSVLTVRTIGASGSAVHRTTGNFNDTIKSTVSTSSTTINTTTTNDLTVTIEWDAADASNTVTINQTFVEFIG